MSSALAVTHADDATASPCAEELLELIAKTLDGDKSVQAPEGRDRASALARAILERVGKTRLSELERVVEFSILASETAISCARILNATEEISGRTQRVAGASGEFTSSIEQIETAIAETSSFAAGTREMAQRGRSSAAAATSSMERVAESISAAVARIDGLAAASQQIGEIVGAIGKIAQQTNLLAVNASIEAARAGPAGRGFAIVAGEVKSLSDQTTHAARDIRDRIESLQGEVSAIVGSMRSGAEAIEQGRETVTTIEEDMNRDMNKVAGQVEELERSLTDIARSVSEQRGSAQSVASEAVAIDEDCRKNLESARHVDKIAQQSVSLVSQTLSDQTLQTAPGAVLRLAKADHAIWKMRLVGGFLGQIALRPDELRSHRHCRLGTWYYSQGPEQDALRKSPAFGALEAPHETVHRCGVEAARRMEAGDHDGALELINELETASAEVLRGLDALIRDERR